MGWRSIETAAWFLLYAGLIGFVLLWNTASPTYNAVYRDRSAADWLPEATRAYVPGTEITGNAPSPFFDGGWWRPEETFRWGRGARNALVIAPAQAIPAGSRIVFEIGILPVRLLREYRVDVLVNGETAGRIVAASEARTFELALPFALPAGEPAVIAFLPQVAKSPLSQGYGGDPREMGVRFYRLTIVPPE